MNSNLSFPIKGKKLKAYLSVFLVSILASCLTVVLTVSEVASTYAARSIEENICATAGRSVLSSYNKSLYERYGIFLMRKSEMYACDMSEFYIKNSLQDNGIIRLSVDSISVNADAYDGADTELLKEQLCRLYASVNLYISKHFSSRVNPMENCQKEAEIEYILFGKSSDRANERAAEDALLAARSLVNLARIYADEAKMAQLKSEAAQTDSVPLPVAVLTLASAEAATLASQDVDALVKGETIPVEIIEGVEILQDFGTYEDYLSAFLLLVDSDTKLARVQSVIEENIQAGDDPDFSFKLSSYGYDLKVVFSKKNLIGISGKSNKKGTVEQSICYQ